MELLNKTTYYNIQIYYEKKLHQENIFKKRIYDTYISIKKIAVLTQIRERAEWLADMEDLGQAGPHRDLIKDQIAERMRALDALGVDSHCSSARSSASGFSVLCNETARTSNSGKTGK